MVETSRFWQQLVTCCFKPPLCSSAARRCCRCSSIDTLRRAMCLHIIPRTWLPSSAEHRGKQQCRYSYNSRPTTALQSVVRFSDWSCLWSSVQSSSLGSSPAAIALAYSFSPASESHLLIDSVKQVLNVMPSCTTGERIRAARLGVNRLTKWRSLSIFWLRSAPAYLLCLKLSLHCLSYLQAKTFKPPKFTSAVRSAACTRASLSPREMHPHCQFCKVTQLSGNAVLILGF